MGVEGEARARRGAPASSPSEAVEDIPRVEDLHEAHDGLLDALHEEVRGAHEVVGVVIHGQVLVAVGAAQDGGVRGHHHGVVGGHVVAAGTHDGVATRRQAVGDGWAGGRQLQEARGGG